MDEKQDLLDQLKSFDIDIQALTTGAIATVIIGVLAFLIWILASKTLKTLTQRSRISPQTILPIRLVLRYGIFLGAIVLSISAFGIPIGNFWTFISTILGLIAIGFVAVWSVLSNISSTFFLIGFKPFKVGDYVKVVGDEINGRVIDINFMFTTLRRKNGDIFKIPNNQFFQKAILRPGDSGTSLEEEVTKQETKTAEKDEALDHSQQNLEGIDLSIEHRNK